MTAPTPSPTISAAPPAWAAADWNALRTTGLAYVERYAHALWTDYNRHDPGVTILELLCYAITDLSQRTSLDTKDLLRSAYASDADMAASFLAPHDALTTSPVTVLDYRKLLLDVPGVRNAWLRPHAQRVNVALPDPLKYADPLATQDPAAHARLSYPVASENEALAAPKPDLYFDLQGLYDITVDLDPDFLAASSDPDAAEQVLANVRNAYLAQRNLGEDCVSVAPLPVQWLVLCADIDLVPGASAQAVQAQLLLAVDQYLAPPVPRYSLAEMLAMTDANSQPLTADQIFEGPLLQNGFIREADLQASTLRRTVYASDIVALAQAVPGLAAIRNLRLSALKRSGPPTPVGFDAQDFKASDFQLFGETEAGTSAADASWVIDASAAGQAWQLSILPGHQPQLEPYHTSLNFYQGILPVGTPTEKQAAINQFKELKSAAAATRARALETLPFPTGTSYDLTAYRPLALDFPANYGIGPAGLPAQAPAERRNQARQLKAYLLFFDQLLANYLAQLANVGKLFGTDSAQNRTYFGQLLHDTGLPGVEELYALTPDSLTPEMVATPAAHDREPAVEAVRKNRFLDHLLARFAENFSEYGLLMYSREGQREGAEMLKDKAALAGDLGRFRPARAYDYSQPCWQEAPPLPLAPGRPAQTLARIAPPVLDDNPNVAGITQRFGRLAGMSNFRPRSSASASTGGGAPHGGGGQQPGDDEAVVIDGELPDGGILGPVAGFSAAVESDSGPDDETIFVVEHLLLRPDEARPDDPTQWMPACTAPDGSYCEPLDPYSFRVSIVLPGYTTRFQDVDYRRYAERMLRLELPAHVLARICWVGVGEMATFEEAYRDWLEQQQIWASLPAADRLEAAALEAKSQSRRTLVKVLNSLHTVHHAGWLYTCGTTEHTPLVLGRTSLGSVMEPPKPVLASDELLQPGPGPTEA